MLKSATQEDLMIDLELCISEKFGSSEGMVISIFGKF